MRDSTDIATAIEQVNGIVAAQNAALQSVKTALEGKAAGSTDVSLGVTGARVGDIVKVKAVDENGKPTEWETYRTRIDTIVDFTFPGGTTLATTEGLSDYILWNNQKAVWNKDAKGNLLKAVRMWGLIVATKEFTVENNTSENYTLGFSLFACVRGGQFYQDTPSSWFYGDDTGNGTGTGRLGDDGLLRVGTRPQWCSTNGFYDHAAKFGWMGNGFQNSLNWLNLSTKNDVSTGYVNNIATPGYYKDYIYGVMLTLSNPSTVIPEGVRILVVAEVIDE